MTGSGMGCPDWPKCFGYYIPPTQISQIQWQPNQFYKKESIIIKDEALSIATADFISGNTYQESNWKPYTKHDYAKFNAWHTWIEYINRLVTVLSGIPILLMFLFSFRYWKKKKSIPILATLTIFAMLFQAWLGKVVVDSNLLPVRITIHMLVAFVILAILLAILYQTRENNLVVFIPSTFKIVLVISVILTLIQVALGTQVRQYVDEQIKLLGESAKAQWLNPAPFVFYIHRTFSILVFICNGWLFWQHKKYNLNIHKINWILILIGFEAFTGIIMYYFNFPFLSQPLHLLLSSLLFGAQFYVLMEVFNAESDVKE